MEFKSTVKPWLKESGSSSSITATFPSPPSTPQTREWGGTPFKRSCSRMFYSSQSDSCPASANRDKPARIVLGLSNDPKAAIENVPIQEEASSSGEDAGGFSPMGSFRGSLRRSPFYRSHDSGYSDSDESTTGAHNDSDTTSTSAPNSSSHVKHITRVYFGESPQHDASTEDHKHSSYISSNHRTSSPSTQTPSPISSSDSSPGSCKRSSNWSSLSCEDSNRTLDDLDELSEQLEYKSILEAARIAVAVRKRSTGLYTPARRLQRWKSSIEKLQSEPQAQSRRPRLQRARRRLCIADAQKFRTPLIVPPTTSKQTITCDLASANNRSFCENNIEQQLGHGTPLASENSFTCEHFSAILALTSLPHNYASVPSDGSEVQSCLSPTASRDTPDNLHAASRLTFNGISSILPRKKQVRLARIHPTDMARDMQNGSVQQWLTELCHLFESECMNTLQSKSLPDDSDKPHSTVNVRAAIHAIQCQSYQVSTEFARLCQRLEWLQFEELPKLAQSLVDHINNFLREYGNHPKLQPQSSLGDQSRVIEQICSRLTEVCKDCSSNSSNLHDVPSEIPHITRQVVQVVTVLGHAFTKLVDLILSREIKVVIRAIEEPSVEVDTSAIQITVSHLTSLGVDGGHICHLIAHLGGIRALLGLCLEPRLRKVRVAALRALATVCCVVEGIQELEKAGGIEVVSDILCDDNCPEEERSEAAGVLAQITSPWVENNLCLLALHQHMDSIVKALTGLGSSTRSAEIFLLASAALANLSFLDESCVSAMRAAGTHKVLIQAQRDNTDLSIFTKDQIATVLANLAGFREAAQEVVDAGGIACLLALLQTKSTSNKRLRDDTTSERVQQKSAIALSRLCGEESAARKLVELGGADRLVQLCKDDVERNHSDAVLVACIAALRKISSTLGPEELQGIDAAELVEPKLMDSFLIYSSKRDSYIL
ncbi:unnamed protein product [Meganyctiphanes norvegica]|uniref:Protein inscuteable homologue C-terminal domain-containing protein n=1 Tax=Meganyctiphanes norvegica TaxID=48144 RepID=A0AAV2R703_MEGNR